MAPKIRMQILGSSYAFKLVKNIIGNFLNIRWFLKSKFIDWQNYLR